jgi:hypothetical protein
VNNARLVEALVVVHERKANARAHRAVIVAPQIGVSHEARAMIVPHVHHVHQGIEVAVQSVDLQTAIVFVLREALAAQRGPRRGESTAPTGRVIQHREEKDVVLIEIDAILVIAMSDVLAVLVVSALREDPRGVLSEELVLTELNQTEQAPTETRLGRGATQRALSAGRGLDSVVEDRFVASEISTSALTTFFRSGQTTL